MMSTFPAPSTEQQNQSQKLSQHIREIIECAPQNTISFAQYMDLALYTPQLGYYMADNPVFGWEGDFTTAPELGNIFAQCLSESCMQVLQETGGNILEIGAGSGKLAADLLSALPALPDHYYILEISPALQQRQRQYLQEKIPNIYERVVWLEQLPENFKGIIIANEVMDALPAECFAINTSGIHERAVTLKDNHFAWTLREANNELQNLLQKIDIHDLPKPYHSELQSRLPTWIDQLAQCLQQGVILLIDYGFPRREYYHPDRSMGTLICHYRQHTHSDPFRYPGLQDITVHVDFTTVAEQAMKHDLEILGFTSQAQFLIEGGLIEILQQNPDLGFSAKHQIQMLTSPAEMGELFKVMGLARECILPLRGLSGRVRAF
jgi:SAM-dependent MidA family methyltransferase